MYRSGRDDPLPWKLVLGETSRRNVEEVDVKINPIQ